MAEKGSASSGPSAEKTTKTTSSTKSTSVIVAYAVQCDKCHNWRKLATEEHFEEFRCNHTKDPFVCDKLPGTTCEKPVDIHVDSTRVWVLDGPSVPKTPNGFKRLVTVRSDYTKVDVQYLTPDGRKIRSSNEMAHYLTENPKFSHVAQSDFSFLIPKIMRDSLPDHMVRKPTPGSGIPKRRKLK